MQQTQVATSGAVTSTTSPTKTTQKQYTSNPKVNIAPTTQTSVMKPAGMSSAQNQSKSQNWKGKRSEVGTTSTTNSGVSLPTTSKNDKHTGPITRSKAKSALIQLFETISENLLSDSETECEDNGLSDRAETEVHEDYIHVSHSDIEEQ